MSRNVTCLDVPCDGVISLSVDGRRQRDGKLEKLSYFIAVIKVYLNVFSTGCCTVFLLMLDSPKSSKLMTYLNEILFHYTDSIVIVI